MFDDTNNSSAQHHALRRQHLQQSLIAEQLDLLLVTNPFNVTYLTGFSGESSYLAVGRDRTILISDGRFVQQMADECPGLETHFRPTSQTLPQVTAEVLSKLGIRSVGFESGHLTVAEWETLRELTKTIDWKGKPDRVERLRIIKDASEVAQICEAIGIAERAFIAFCNLLRPEDSEKDLADALESHIRRIGGKCSSFPSIVAVGERSALAHAPPTQRSVAESDFLLVDWGASGRFYKSDLTRVILTRKNSAFSHGRGFRRPGPKLEEIHELVLRAQQAALAVIRPGVKGQEVDAAARAVFAEAGYSDHFGHGLGHGIGLEVHEGPTLRPKSEAILQPGMVVTVEPGLYFPGWGGVRIEDDVLVTADGYNVLTSVPRELTPI